MKKDGTNTERTHSMASSRGIAVLRQASTTAIARDIPDVFAESSNEWIFSISTVASSTSTPTASARPPSVIMLIVCPVIHNQTTAESSAKGIVRITMTEVQQSRKNKSTITPVRSAARALYVMTPFIAVPW